MDDNETRIVEQFAEWLTRTHYVYIDPDDAANGKEVSARYLVDDYAAERAIDEMVVTCEAVEL